MNKNIRIILITMSVLLTMRMQTMQEMQEQSLREQEQQMAKLFPETQLTWLARKALTSPKYKRWLNNELLGKAIEENREEEIQRLLKLDIDVNSSIGRSARKLLHKAVEANMPLVVQELLSVGADPNATELHGFTPLHIAAREGNIEIIKMLIEAGADINKENRFGVTPVGFAVIYKNISAVKTLLARPEINLDTQEVKDIIDVYGNNPQYQDVVRLISSHLMTLKGLSTDEIVKNINYFKDKLHLLPEELREEVNKRLAQ